MQSRFLFQERYPAFLAPVLGHGVGLAAAYTGDIGRLGFLVELVGEIELGVVSEPVSHLEIPVRDDPAALVLDDLLFLSLRRGNDGGVFGYQMPVVGILVPRDLSGLLVGDHRLIAVGGAVPEKSEQREQQKYRRNDASVYHCAIKATPHNPRLTPLHVICLHIFRHNYRRHQR